MKSLLKKSTLLLIIFFITQLTYSQPRLVVLPFQNQDGNLKLNEFCYSLQDSVIKALKAKDPQGIKYQIVPVDSIEQVLASLNLDPNNPQYPSDLWKVVDMFKVPKVLMGNFSTQADRILINAYIYDTDTRLPILSNQARDIFKTNDKVLESVSTIVRKLWPLLDK